MKIENIFDEIEGKRQKVSREILTKFRDEWNLPLSETELTNLKKSDIKPSYWDDKAYGEWKPKDFEKWNFPQSDFPIKFYELIENYAGCSFLKGEREFSVFGPQELREMNIAYEFPEYIKDAVSFGLDGSGNHIVFDMRSENNHSEFKVYGVHSGYLDWEGAKLIANNFQEFINGTENIDELMNG